MTKITIFSGFLGAGKTTLIKKLIKEGYNGEKLVLIENEFGQIGIDGGFLKDAGIEITEMNSGCICCSLVGDFGKALVQVLEEYKPDRIIIEPSGVGKLSDVIAAVRKIDSHDVELDGFTTVVDAKKCKMYQKNFGEFFNNQIEHASCVILSHTGGLSQEKIADAIEIVRKFNETAPIVTTDWDELSGKQIVDAMTQKNTLENELKEMIEHQHHHHHEDGECCCGHHHDHEHEHHHHEDGECCCGHHHDHEHEHHHHEDGECCCGHHHDHEHEHHHHEDGECCCGHHHDHEHEHHHHEDGECCCGHHHDHEHHHHHADEVFTSWGAETPRPYTIEAITAALEALADEEKFGIVLRAKGIVAAEDGKWIHFDYIPGTPDVRYGTAETTGRLCVIGSKLNEEAVAKLFCL
ncbi:MAG: GTP-binding protein [Ruminococcus sp.]|nr:GTP-binding protein [Ruminococcus sp.]